MTEKLIRVLMVDASKYVQDFLARTLSMDLTIDVVGVVSGPRAVFQAVRELRPNIVTLDIDIPHIGYREILQRLHRELPGIPVIVISSLSDSVFDALECGAVDFVTKPDIHARMDNSAFMREVQNKIKTVYSAASSGLAPQPPVLSRHHEPALNHAKDSFPLSGFSFPGTAGRNRIIAIGASTGGTEAILKVVRELPTSTPGIVIVQHMPPVFTKMYAERLDHACKMRAKEAEDGDRVRPGWILVAEGSRHMRVRKDCYGYYVQLQADEKVSGHRPSVDVLFESVAGAAGANAVGVILTGMGADGASSLLKMKEAGAYTIGQDEVSCVVYGMPMVAYNLGAVTDQLPLEAIPGAIVRHLSR